MRTNADDDDCCRVAYRPILGGRHLSVSRDNGSKRDIDDLFLASGLRQDTLQLGFAFATTIAFALLSGSANAGNGNAVGPGVRGVKSAATRSASAKVVRPALKATWRVSD